MTLDYFYGRSGELFSYFRIPKALFQDCRFRQLLQCRRNPCFDGACKRRSNFVPISQLIVIFIQESTSDQFTRPLERIQERTDLKNQTTA